MSGDAKSISDGNVRGHMVVTILAVTFEFIFSGLWIFSMNETPVGEREQSFTDGASLSLFMSTTL